MKKCRIIPLFCIIILICSGCSAKKETLDSADKDVSLDVISQIEARKSDDVSDNAFDNVSDYQDVTNYKSEIMDDADKSSIEEPEKSIGEYENDEFVYELYTNHVEVVKYIGKDLRVVIPDEIEGYEVTSIKRKEYGFDNDCFPKNIVSVDIPDTVKVIGDSVFFGSGVVSVKLSDSLVKIGSRAFSFCTKLKSINLPDSLETIEEGAFRDCKCLENIKLPPKIKFVDGGAFDNTKMFSGKLEIPATLNEYGVAFSEQDITELKFLGKPTSIPDSAFSHCEKLKKVELPDTIKTIGIESFFYCTELNEINFPDSLSKISERAFMGTGLERIYLSSNIVYGCDAFNNTMITDVEVPNEIVFESWGLFTSCKQLKMAKIDSQTIPFNMFKECTDLQEVFLTENVLRIERCAFDDCVNLKIHIPSSVVDIDDEAFDTYNKKIIIYGSKGSVAEEFSRNHDIKFMEE